MVDQRIIEYIQKCEKANISREDAIKNLEGNGWPSEMIQEALTTILSLPAYSPAKSSTIVQEAIEIKPSKLVGIISSLFISIGIIYLISTFVTVYIIIMLNKGVEKAYGVPFSILKSVPIIIILPPLASLASLLFIYSGLKIKNASRFSFRLGLTVLISIFLIFFFIGVMSGLALAKIETTLNQ